jgi:hypothetical protein
MRKKQTREMRLIEDKRAARSKASNGKEKKYK